jgi:hypothetical protein
MFKNLRFSLSFDFIRLYPKLSASKQKEFDLFLERAQS